MLRSLTSVLLLLVALSAHAEPPAEPSAAEREAAQRAGVPTEEIQRYVAVYRAIRQAYVEPLSDEQLMRAALRGLLLDLDPHSAYLRQDEAEALDELAHGHYIGIGIEIEQQADRSIVIIAPLDGSPAARAGLRSGDVITAIDGKALDVEHADAASQLLRGEAGSRIVLTVLSPGSDTPRDVEMQREQIDVDSVESRLLEPGFAYLRVASFQVDTAPQLRRQLAAMSDTSGGALQGVVLDLRSNPGGLLHAAVEVADAFLDSGVIVSTRGRLSYSNAEYRAKPGDASGGADMVVLIDSGTASAAEVLAGALRDHERATLMGSRSFGKGSVQTVMPLDNGDSVKLTTARYYTPSGKSIQARGIKPDVVLRGKAARGLREQDLPRHISGSDEQADGYAKGELIAGDAAIEAALAHLHRRLSASSAPR
ncbi:MAG TPA: S41 family peptidase [Arenimonas sp.]|nr:S41 family peptidase [Arenimonas sp.]